ncbi:MAG TPA: class I SAM-dependent methyltransferase [Acidobacteriaceae bacterium]|jgi:ubiquinone/menaquinone biosynthesis C-methylase UbiE
MTASAQAPRVAGLAFDSMAESYDASFTESSIGRSQRDVVWRAAERAFKPGEHILELNCGTGEDALHLASLGMRVTACDASEKMISCALDRILAGPSPDSVEFNILPNEQLGQLSTELRFDGAFSNFSGLNCTENLVPVVDELNRRLNRGASLLFCVSTRICIWETLYYVAKGRFRKAFRRWSGVTQVNVSGYSFWVYYPTVATLRRIFQPHFRLRSIAAVGLFVPPSYLEPWMRKHPRLLRIAERLDGVLRTFPLLRVAGDHVLLHFEKLPA